MDRYLRVLNFPKRNNNVITHRDFPAPETLADQTSKQSRMLEACRGIEGVINKEIDNKDLERIGMGTKGNIEISIA